MAHFYGTVQGQRGKASRLGTSKSGMVTYCTSWEGAVCCDLSVVDGVDHVNVSLVPWHGRGTNKLLYSGPVSGAKPKRPNATKG